MRGQLTRDQRRVLKIASARSSTKLSIGGGEKKIRPPPISLGKVPAPKEPKP